MDFTYPGMDTLEEWLSGSPHSDQFLYGYPEEVDEGFCDSDENSQADPSAEDIHPPAHSVPSGQGEEYDAGYGDIDRMFELNGFSHEAVKSICDAFPDALPPLATSFPVSSHVNNTNWGPAPAMYPTEDARVSLPPSPRGPHGAELSEAGVMLPAWGTFNMPSTAGHPHIHTQHQSTSSVASSPPPTPQSVHNSGAYSHSYTNEQTESEDSVSPIPGYSSEELVHMPYQEFKTLVRQLKLDTATLRKAKEVRKRGKNKLAAKNCRQRKIDSVSSLNGEILHLRQQLKTFAYEKESLIRELRVWKAKCSALESQSNSVHLAPMKPPLYCSPM